MDENTVVTSLYFETVMALAKCESRAVIATCPCGHWWPQIVFPKEIGKITCPECGEVTGFKASDNHQVTMMRGEDGKYTVRIDSRRSHDDPKEALREFRESLNDCATLVWLGKHKEGNTHG